MKRKSVYITIMLLLLLLTVGCAPESTSNAKGSGSNEKSQVVIRYWDLADPKGDDPRSKALAENLQAFEKENPGIKIQVEVLPWAQIAPQLMKASGAGNAPDVVRLSVQDLTPHVRAGNLLALDQFADDEFKKDWLLGWDQLIFDQKKMALPLDYRASVLYYRSDFLKDKNPPKTWDEMLALSKELPNDQRSGVMLGFGRGGLARASTEALISYLWEAGVPIFDDQGKAAFNNEKGYKVFERLTNLVKEKYTPQASLSYTYEEVFQSLKAGTGVFTLLGSHRAEAARAAANLMGKLHLAPLPGMNNEGKPAPAHVFGWSLVISKGSQHPQEAWKFIKFMTSKQTQLNQVKLAGELPTRKSPYDDSWFESEQGKELAAIAKYIQDGRILKYPEHFTQMAEFWTDAFQSIIINNVSVKQAVDESAKKYDSLLK